MVKSIRFPRYRNKSKKQQSVPVFTTYTFVKTYGLILTFFLLHVLTKYIKAHQQQLFPSRTCNEEKGRNRKFFEMLIVDYDRIVLYCYIAFKTIQMHEVIIIASQWIPLFSVLLPRLEILAQSTLQYCSSSLVLKTSPSRQQKASGFPR